MPQSLSNLLSHLVFSTHHRDPSLTPEIRSELFPYFAGALHNKGCPAIRIGGVDDHVHLLFSLSRTVAIADVVKSIKGSSSIWIKEHFGGKRDFAWQSGYGVFSVGQGEIDSAAKYIQSQEEHHRRVTFQEEYRELMKLAGVELDERYAWE